MAAARRVLDASWEGLRGLEGRAAATAASLLGALYAEVHCITVHAVNDLIMIPWPAVRRVLDAGWEGLRGLEGRAAATAASLLGAQWPAQRWPIHVFTGGAITCMLTSSVCHLLGCCSFHISQVRGAWLPCAACQPYSWARTRVPLQMCLQECEKLQRENQRKRLCRNHCCQKSRGWADNQKGGADG